MTTIGKNAFDNCVKLKGVTIPASVTEIGDDAFVKMGTDEGVSECAVAFNTTGLNTIPESCFRESGVTSVTLPSNLTTISKNAFQKCEKLTTIVLPASLATLGESAFNGCSKLATVTFTPPTTLATIGTSAFADCTLLKAITLPEGTTTISANAFNGSGLTDIFLPTTATNINASAIPSTTKIHRALNLTDDGSAWATYYSAETLDIDDTDKLEAFVVTGISDDNTTLNTTAINFIPKETAILVHFKASVSGALYGTSSTKTLPEGVTPDTELFRGTIAPRSDFQNIPGYKYVLTGGQFVRAHQGTLPAFRGYLVLSNGSDAAPNSIYLKNDDGNTIIIQEEGTFNKAIGTASLSTPADGKITLTVSPTNTLFYAAADNITVRRTTGAGKAKAPRRAASDAPGLDQNTIAVTALDATADPSGTTQYTFPHTTGYNYEVTVNFQKRINLIDASLNVKVELSGNTGLLYDGKEKKPTVTTITYSGGTIDPSDYDIAYSSNVNAGTGQVIIKAKRRTVNDRTVDFNIGRRELSLATVEAIADQTYTGSAIEPTITVKDIPEGASESIIGATDYTIEYGNNTNVGTATVTLMTTNKNYTGSKTGTTFKIVAKDLSTTATISTIAEQDYTGEPIEPTVVVMNAGVIMDASNYDVSYANNTNVGTATVTVTFKGNYKGSVSSSFKIKEAILTRTLDLDFSGTDKWATYYSAENLTLPDGIQAYVVTGISSDKKTLNVQQVEFIPENIPVLLQRTGSQTSPFYGKTMPTGTSLPSAITPDATHFIGTATGTTLDGDHNNYVLTADQFVLATNESLAAHRAYVRFAKDEKPNGLIIGKGYDTVVLKEEGAENARAGSVKLNGVDENGRMTITVTPINVLYAEARNISVVRTANSTLAHAPQRTPGISESSVEVSAVDPTADPSNPTKYTFDYDGSYNYQIVVDFQKRLDLLKKETKPIVTLNGETGLIYDGKEKKPTVVSLKCGDEATVVDPSNYDISYESNVNAGTARVVITGKRYLKGATHATFNIAQRNINLVTVEAIADQTYTGSAIEPTLVVKDIPEGATESIIDENEYNVVYASNTDVGTATISIEAKNRNYHNIKTGISFKILPKDVTETAKIDAIADHTYTGYAIEPAVTVKDGETTIDASNYTVSYAGNVSIGTAKVTVTFKQNYTGSIQGTFNIVANGGDGITLIGADDAQQQWFDLNGHRLQDRPTKKGLYILRTQDGKSRKVVIGD